MDNFRVSKIARTCDPACSPTPAASLLTVASNANNIVTCTTSPTEAPDLTDRSALQCYQCSAGSSSTACKNAQTGASTKVGGVSLSRTAACTQCYVSDVRPARGAAGSWCGFELMFRDDCRWQ